MKKRFLTLIFTITAMLLCIFGLSACGKVEFKVNFVVDGEVYATLNTNGEEIIKMPENPTKEDYTFDGWYWDKDTWQTPFTANSLLDAPLSSDMSVYAKFTKKHEHNYTATVTEPTCTEKGYTTYTCDCGDNYKDNYVNELGHEFLNYVSDNNATYDRDGTKTAYCTHGCGTTDIIPDTGTKLQSEIVFKTLSVDNELTVYGKVPNKQATFSFINEVEIKGNATFVVSTDIYGIQQIPTKTVPLEIGDNTFYITETVGNNIRLFTVTVRRRPVYTVSFDSNGGTAVQSQQVEEDSFASRSTTTRTGYTFSYWDYDFATPITQDTEITAIWTANTNTPYTVEYYLQNLADENYTLETTENKTGTTDTMATAEIKTFEHFTYNATATDSGKINGDGSTVLKVYYTRDTYTVTFDGNGGTLVSGSERQTVKYGGSVTAPTYTRSGYTFNGYDKTNYTNISESFTVTATWTINQYTLTIVYDNGQDNKVITQDYNTSIESIANPERAGYGFTGWDKTMPITMPAENLTVTAKWNAIFTLSGGTVTGLTDYSKNNYTKLNIPSKIDGVTVTSIGSSAFNNCSSLTSVTIPDSVTSIGSSAFNNCSSLTSVIIPNSVTRIGSSAFSGCSGIKEITIPFVGATVGKTASDTYQYPFGYIFGTSSYTGGTETQQYYYGSYTSSITSTTYYIPSSLRKVTVTGGNILYGAFYNCSSLTSVTIPNNVTSIGSSAFNNCSSLTSVTIPDGVTSVGSSAFYNCSSLTSVTIPDGVTSIGEWAFSGCSSLTSVTIPNSVKSIGSYAFRYCSSLTSVTIPNSVTSISSSAFENCSSLTSVTIPDSVTSIGYGAFSNCRSLTSVIIPNSVTSIGELAFSGCSSLTSVTIPNSVTSISSYAFSYCSSLTSVTIPDSVTSIGDYAFYNCSSLTSVTIPDSVKSIGSYAFYNCSSLTSVTIPDCVTNIGEWAFSGCSSLTSVYITDIAAWCKISFGNGPANPLYYAHNLYLNNDLVTELTIPNSVTSIGSSAFYNCSSLTSVTIPDSVTRIGSSAFSGCSSLEEITIPFVGAVAGKTASNTYQYPFGYIFGTSSYTGGSAVTQNYYGSSTSSITYDMYYIPSSLRKVTVTGGNILYGAFDNCSRLTSVTIPDSVTSIGSSAFSGCSSLTSVTIPDSVTSIDSYAFSGCRRLTSVTIPDSVTSIGYGAFRGCSSLTSITIPDSVTSIGEYAFYNCSSLTRVYYTGTAEQWSRITIGSYNTNLYNATRYYYSATSPTDEGKYWHYDENGNIVVW